MDQWAAGTRHQGDALRLSDCLGYFDGTTFHAAGDQGGQHLQHNGRPVRFGRVVHVHAEDLAQDGSIADHGSRAGQFGST